MPGPDGTITQAEQATLLKGRIRYNRAQVRERATELFQALHVLRTLDADAHDAIVADRGECSISSRSPATRVT